MKSPVRHIYFLLMAGTLLLTGCQKDGVLIEVVESNMENPGNMLINFSNGMIDNPVGSRSVVSMLSDHNHSMGVWGWQYTPTVDTTRLFNNQIVSFDSNLAIWTYNPIKYWNRGSSYKFFAYSPHSSSVQNVSVRIDSVTHRIGIDGITLTGCNNVPANGPYDNPGNFSNVSDIDWLIDRAGQESTGITKSKITFIMQHILSKISVRVFRDEMVADDQVVPVVVDSIMIGDFVCQGNFSQVLTQNPLVETQTDIDSKISEWTLVDTLPRITLNGIENASIPNHSTTYLMESLLIPQTVTPDQKIHIWYTVGRDNEYKTQNYAQTTLNTLFDIFVAGNSYVVNIVLNKSADMIRFDSGVSDWDSKAAYRIIEI